MVEGGRHSYGVTVQFKRRVAGAVVDGFQTKSYGDWFDVEGCAVKYGLSDASEDESVERDVVLHGAIVYAPPLDDPPGEYDLARLPGDDEEYKVAGRPVLWKNPWQAESAGTEIRLERTTG